MDAGDKRTLCKSSRVRVGKAWEDHFEFFLGPRNRAKYTRSAGAMPPGRPLIQSEQDI